MNNGLFQARHQRMGHYALLLAISAGLFFLNLGGASLWDVDEGRNSGAALDMYETGNYVVPTFNGELRVDKPALLYWLQVGAYHVFGITEFSVRFPSALAALVTVLLCYELGRRMFNPGAALLASLIVASSPMFCAAARFANPDALLNCFTALVLFLFWKGFRLSGKMSFFSTGIAAGLAVLAKGPVGLFLPLSIIGLYLFWNRRLHLFLSSRFFLGILAFAVVALPWYICVAIETRSQFLQGFIMVHNFGRIMTPMENHSGSIFYYGWVFLIGFGPWSCFLCLALWYGAWSLIRNPWPRLEGIWKIVADFNQETPSLRDDEPLQVYRFLFCWIGLYLAFFSLAATKLPNYILPIYVPMALLTGRFLDRWRRGEIRLSRWVIHLTLGFLALVGITTGFGMLLAGGKVRMEFMRDRYVEGMDGWAAMGLLLVAGAGIGWWHARRQNPQGILWSVTIAILLFIFPMAAWGAAALNRHKAPRPLVELAGACQRQKEIRIGCWQLEYLPSLNFYCQRHLSHLQDADKAADFLRNPIPVFLFLPEDDWAQVKEKVRCPFRVLGRHHDIYHACYVLVVTNR